jgi:hypothetical protein
MLVYYSSSVLNIVDHTGSKSVISTNWFFTYVQFLLTQIIACHIIHPFSFIVFVYTVTYV